MRHLSLLLPVFLVCGLLAFLVMRVFDTSSTDASGTTVAVTSRSVEPRSSAASTPPRDDRATSGETGATATPPPAAPTIADPAARVRDELEHRLRSSGTTRETWATEVGGAVDQVLRTPALQAALRNAPTVECFAEGCMARLVFASASDFGLYQTEIGEADALDAWAHVVTGPEHQPDGTVHNALVVFRPPSPEALAAIEAKRAELRSQPNHERSVR